VLLVKNLPVGKQVPEEAASVAVFGKRTPTKAKIKNELRLQKSIKS